MFCPKCGCPDVTADECPKCGVFISKYLLALEIKTAQNIVEEAATLWNEAYKLHYSSGDIAKAEEIYTQIIERHPDSQEARYATQQIKTINKETDEVYLPNTEKSALEELPKPKERLSSEENTLKKKLSQYKEKDTGAIDLYLWLSIIGGIILFAFGIYLGDIYGSVFSIYTIAVSIVSVLFAVIVAGIASDIRETRNILLDVANKIAERNNDTGSK